MNAVEQSSMVINKRHIFSSIFLIAFCGLIYSWKNFATDATVLRSLNQLPQNTLAYLDSENKTVPNTFNQEKHTEVFLKHYFEPWETKISSDKLAEIKADLQEQYRKIEQSPGVGANTRPYSLSWVKSLEQNADLAHFANRDQNAIAFRDTNIRILPTMDPSFSDFASVSKGFPFDNLQQTFIPAGTPLHIIHVSKDKAWFLVSGAGYSGWVQDKDTAFVSPSFKAKWQTGSYAVSLKDNIPFVSTKKNLTPTTRIGVLYPIAHSTENDFQILIPSENEKGDAVFETVSVNKKTLTPFPFKLNQKNIAIVANNLIGKPYGWGGIYGYRDCSSTTKDLMATFGIWLPRNSSAQTEVGQYTSLANKTNVEKEKIIINNAIPFLTLIHIPGHIVLYIGQENGHPIVFQNVWGLHVYKLFNDKDRVVIGRTVITPLNFGKDFVNVTLSHLKNADGMTTLTTPIARS